jgi:protein CpxP
MKKMNVVVVAITALGLVGLTTAAYAVDAIKCEPSEHRQGSGEMGEGFGPRHQHMDDNRQLLKDELKLTDDQKKTLAAARKAQEPAMQDLHEKMRAAHDALDKAGDANADDATLTNLSTNLASLIAQQEVARIKAHKQMLSVLTPEQKQKLESLKAEHKDDRHWQDKRLEKPKQ